jgi:putative autoinducer-2 (AI-2) aldolase
MEANMPDTDNAKVSKNYHLDKPFRFAPAYDWGMAKRMANIFDPKSGNTVMFAFDHGYFMGSVSGLERLDVAVPPLMDYIDVLMATRGALRTCIDPNNKKGVALRVSSGSSMLNDDLSHEIVAVDIEDAIRLDADCMAVQTFIGAEGQLSSIDNLSRVINASAKYGIPTLGVVAVGKDMERTDRYFKLATRIVAEMGAHIVKTYYCDNFEEIVAACPVPIVVAGGRKLPEPEALTLAYRSVACGARGVDMGRNIFQSEHPVAMCRAVRKIVHEKFTDKTAYEYYLELINAH